MRTDYDGIECKSVLAEYYGVYLGWNACPHASAISCLNEREPHYVAQASYAIIGRIDSDRNVNIASPTIIKAIAMTGVTVVPMDRSLVTDGAGLGRLLATGELLHGFDEIWLCNRKPEGGVPPSVAVPTAENLVHHGTGLGLRLGVNLEALYDWMDNHGIFSGMSDGLGLRFITSRRDDVHRLMRCDQL